MPKTTKKVTKKVTKEQIEAKKLADVRSKEWQDKMMKTWAEEILKEAEEMKERFDSIVVMNKYLFFGIVTFALIFGFVLGKM